MKRAPSVDALLLVVLVVACLELAQAPAYDSLDHPRLTEQTPPFLDALVPGGPPHPLVVLGQRTGPVRLAARSGSMLLLILYLLADVLERGRPSRRAGWLKAALAAGLAGLLVFLPAGLLIAARAATGNADLAHDGGTVQVEEAARMLAAGRNPYAESYAGTPLATWRGFASDAVLHLPYLPMGFLPTVVLLPLCERLLGWYDQRLLYLALYAGLAVLIAAAAPAGERRRTAVLGVAFNPFLVRYLILGTNDVAALFWLAAAVLALARRRPLAAGALLGLAAATKHLAILAVPFFALYLWQAQAEVPAGAAAIVRERLRPLARWGAGLLATLALTIGPFFAWGPRAMIEDVLLYPGGGLPTSFPIQGLHGYGFGSVPLFFRWVPHGRADFPFLAIQLAALAVVVPLLIAYQKRARSLAAAVHAFALALLVFLFFARYFHANFAGLALALPFLAYGLAGDAGWKPAPQSAENA